MVYQECIPISCLRMCPTRTGSGMKLSSTGAERRKRCPWISLNCKSDGVGRTKKKTRLSINYASCICICPLLGFPRIGDQAQMQYNAAGRDADERFHGTGNNLESLPFWSRFCSAAESFASRCLLAIYSYWMRLRECSRVVGMRLSFADLKARE